MDPQVEFSLQLTEKDIAAGPMTRRRFVYERCAFFRGCHKPCGCNGTLPVARMVSKALAVPFLLGLSLPSGILLIYAGTFMVGAFRRAGVRRFRLSPSASVKMCYQLFDDHLTVTSELSHSDIRWQAFLMRKETVGYFYLMLNSVQRIDDSAGLRLPNQALELQEFVRSAYPRWIPKRSGGLLTGVIDQLVVETPCYGVPISARISASKVGLDRLSVVAIRFFRDQQDHGQE